MLFQKQVDRLAKLLRHRRRARLAAAVASAAMSRPLGRRYPIIEAMERRLLMAADPIQIGGVYVEEDFGSDLHGDLFYVTFQGGAEGTELKRLTIDGDLNSDGFGLGDLFFDTLESGMGADHSFAFQVEELRTARAGATVRATVEDGSTRLVLDFTNFMAGDTLIFSIDVDEVQFYDPNETDLGRLNENFDPITSGVEFQNSRFQAEFSAPHFFDVAGNSRFLNRYDDWLDQTGLPLPRDNEDGKRDRSAGTGFEVVQQPKPVSLSGRIYVDKNEDLVRQSGEPWLLGVQLELFQLQAGTFVSTGHVTSTDSQGRYSFGTDLNLEPGTYQVRETQPSGYYSVGATLGRLNGNPVGQLVPGNPNALTNIDLRLGDSHATDLNFAENLPSSISGHVCVAVNGFDCFDESSQTQPLSGVTIELRDASGNLVQTTLTGADGSYQFNHLRAGTYSVTELTPAGLLDGDSRVGSAGGNRVNANLIQQIYVGGGLHGADYDFCEMMPASLSGHTYFDRNNNGVRETVELPLSGVLVSLWTESGAPIASTRTNAEGYYLFENLRPGTYRLMEETPVEYSPGKAAAGTIGGRTVGQTDASGDLVGYIALPAGQTGVNYDFGEILKGSISGNVFVDSDGDCRFDAGESPIPFVTIELLGSDGRVLRTTTTDSAGHYRFDELLPGVYGVREIQPTGFFQGGQRAGTGGGNDSVPDHITAIDLSLGGDVFEYDFCELEPGSLSGVVFVDLDFDCVQDANELPIENVEVQLLSSSGIVLATTRTDVTGRYAFLNLRPGGYAVRELQPSGFFQGGQIAPVSGGDDSVEDLISRILIDSGQAIREANFCEVPPAEISGYVFQDGGIILTEDGQLPEDMRSVRDGQRTTDDTPISGVTLQLRTLTGAPIDGARGLPGYYPDEYIQVRTNANGYFAFAGLRAGSYHVYQIQPAGFEDSIDTPGTTTGYAINQGETDTVPSSIMSLIQLSDPGADPGTDAILAVSVEPGQVSRENNFSEVLAGALPPQTPPVPPATPAPPKPTPPAPPTYASPVNLLAHAALPWNPLPLYVGVGHESSPTWHLSVINGGYPRGARNGQPVDESTVDEKAERLDVYAWTVSGMRDSSWHIVSINPNMDRASPRMVFDIPGAKPLAGDFNGDGFDELALFIDGEWFIDVNGNGRWDEADIWIKLGTHGDQPVVGDWDHDGKDDVGVFGRKWKGDERALATEPGLPDPQNVNRIKPKNLPPNSNEAPDEPRILQRSQRGQARADLIDHVFQFGGGKDQAVTGDFNGDGISTIGTFRDGVWILDIDGDGRLSQEHDRQVFFGQPGDTPVVGDFDGDGIDEIAIVRGNRVIVDSNDNGQIDATDQVFLLDSETGSVIVGDFDGNGFDEPALHQSAAQRRSLEARRVE